MASVSQTPPCPGCAGRGMRPSTRWRGSARSGSSPRCGLEVVSGRAGGHRVARQLGEEAGREGQVPGVPRAAVPTQPVTPPNRSRFGIMTSTALVSIRPRGRCRGSRSRRPRCHRPRHPAHGRSQGWDVQRALRVGRKSGVDGGNGEGGEASMWALRPQSSSITARPSPGRYVWPTSPSSVSRSTSRCGHDGGDSDLRHDRAPQGGCRRASSGCC